MEKQARRPDPRKAHGKASEQDECAEAAKDSAGVGPKAHKSKCLDVQIQSLGRTPSGRIDDTLLQNVQNQHKET